MLRIESTICESMGRTWGCQTRMINFNEKMIRITINAIMRRFDAILTEDSEKYFLHLSARRHQGSWLDL